MIAVINASFIQCPHCGSSSFRSSQVRSTSEKFKSVFGIMPFRCLRCSERFCSSIWNLHAARYARCPKCLRMDLSTWAEEFYRPALGTRMLLRIGATRYRCDFCRCNFASFRPCRKRFSRDRLESASVPAARASIESGRSCRTAVDRRFCASRNWCDRESLAISELSSCNSDFLPI
jgi:DNA-directed RNA polymerase subunit RPC12/RpoP